MALVLGAPQHWRVGVLALVAAIAGPLLQRVGQGTLAAALLAIAAAPVWAGMSPDFMDPWTQGLLAVGAVGWLLGGGQLPVLVAVVVAGAAVVEGGKLWLLSLETLPAAEVLVPLILVPGLLVAVQAGSATASKLSQVVAALLGLVVLGQAWQARALVPQTPAQVEELVARGVVHAQLDALASDPALAKVALGAEPRWNELGQAVKARHGVEVALAAGWDPTTAAMGPGEAVELALLLDERGQGGHGRRLLRSHRGDPTVDWTYALLGRMQGLPLEGPVPEAPPDTPHLPGLARLDWDFFTNGTKTLYWHADRDIVEVSFECWGESWFGDPMLLIEVDGRGLRRVEIEEGRGRVVGMPLILEPGPHVLRISYDNDLDGEGGDRNVGVVSFRAR